MQDDIKDLYDALTADGVDFGSEKDFREDYKTPEAQKELYAALKADGVDFGTEQEFMEIFAPKQQTPTPQTPKPVAQQPKPAPQAAQPKPRKGMIETSIYGDRYKPKNYQEGYKPQPTAVPPSLMRPDEDTTKTRLVKGIEEGQNAFN